MSPNPEPYDFGQARQAFAQAARAQADAERFRIDASRGAAEAERAYRVALARKILEVHADGCAWTVAQDLARGDDRVAGLRYDRDVARGVLDAAEQAGWRHTADRKGAHLMAEWSMRVNVTGEQREPAEREPAIGRRAA